MNPLDEPIARAKVTILNDGKAQDAMTAGEDGRFSFDSVNSGHYELLIEADHFRTLKFPIVTAKTEKKCKKALSISLAIASENCAGVRLVKR
jgi:hypothetical protein